MGGGGGAVTDSVGKPDDLLSLGDDSLITSFTKEGDALRFFFLAMIV